MDPITIAILIGTLIGTTAAVIYIAYLTFVEIINWFNSLKNLLFNRKYSAVTVKQTLKNGKKGIVQGVLNTSNNELVKSRVIEYDELDEQLSDLHARYDVVTYS